MGKLSLMSVMRAPARGVALLSLVALASGCQVSAMATMIPSSKFVYPNSNVTPLTETEGSTSKLCGFIIPWSSPDANDVAEASREAIAKVQGADLLIDVYAETEMIAGPTFPVNIFYFCSVKVRGTAAHMEVGLQQLSPMFGPKSAPKAAPPPPLAPGACRQDTDCPGDQICDPSGACKAPKPRN
jgi:hypothetical protein